MSKLVKTILLIYSCDSEGRYVVRLPFKDLETANLSFNGSYQHAKKVFEKTEARFKSNLELA